MKHPVEFSFNSLKDTMDEPHPKMEGTPILYSLESGLRVKNETCECDIPNYDTPVPSIQCSWKMDDYWIYISFAMSTFSAIFAVIQHGVIPYIESIRGGPITKWKKFFLGKLPNLECFFSDIYEYNYSFSLKIQSTAMGSWC